VLALPWAYVRISEQFPEKFYTAVFVTLAIIAVAFLGFGWRAWIGHLKRADREIVGCVCDYYCNLCENRWQQGYGIPDPEIHMRPDLILAGEQRLQEAERQRQGIIAH